MTNKILFTALMLISLSGFSQTNKVLTGANNQATIYRGGLGSNGAFWLPTHNEDLYTDMPMKGRARFTDKLQVHDGTNWVDVGGGIPTWQDVIAADRNVELRGNNQGISLYSTGGNSPITFAAYGTNGGNVSHADLNLRDEASGIFTAGIDYGGYSKVSQIAVVGGYGGVTLGAYYEAGMMGQGSNILKIPNNVSPGTRNTWILPEVPANVTTRYMVGTVNGKVAGSDGNVNVPLAWNDITGSPYDSEDLISVIGEVAAGGGTVQFANIAGDASENYSLVNYIANSSQKFGANDNILYSDRSVDFNGHGFNHDKVSYVSYNGTDAQTVKLAEDTDITFLYDASVIDADLFTGMSALVRPSGEQLEGLFNDEDVTAVFYSDTAGGEFGVTMEIDYFNDNALYLVNQNNLYPDSVFLGYIYMGKAPIYFHIDLPEVEYNPENQTVVVADENGDLKKTTLQAPGLNTSAAIENTITNKGIRLQNSGELSINLGVYPRQNEISIFDPNEPTLNRIAMERHNIAYTYQPGNVAFKIGFPTSGDGIYKTATFQNKTGDVALLSDVYGRYAERTDITASMSVTALNAAYPNAMGGFEVGCPNMTPPTIYKKMSNTTGWYVIQTTKI